MKVLVTGVNGFVGHHVAAQLAEAGHTVIGCGNQETLQGDLSEIVENYYGLDLTDPEKVGQIDLSGMDAIINLAGFAAVGASAGKQDLYDKVNIGVHTVLYQECINQKVFPRIVAVSTGAVYDPLQPLPIDENGKLAEENKTNEYVISKQRMEQALQPFIKQGLDIVVARPFNHTGPGQLPGFLLPDLAEQVEQASKNNTQLLIGNLTTKRDYTDVRDVAKAYILLATKKDLQHSVYNICSGRSIPGTEILQSLLDAYCVSDLETKVDPNRLRKNDIMDIYGSSERLRTDTGWEPAISTEQMVTDFVNWKQASGS